MLMNSLMQVIYMTLQGFSSAIIDVFFLMTAAVAFMTVFRFGQFSAVGKMTIRKAGQLTIELIVQGIAVGVLYSFLMLFLGLPMIFSEYLYFLLPLAFIIGFYHVRFTNLIYAATMMSVIGLFMSGGTFGNLNVPDIAFSVAGMSLLTGGLVTIMAGVLIVTGTRHLKPIVAKKDQHIVLGFAQQRFWPVPVVALVAIGQLVLGDSVPMPDWWPLLRVAGLTDDETTMFMLPMLLILSHGSISFGFTPKIHIQIQAMIQGITGLVLLIAGYVGSMLGNIDPIVLVIMLLSGAIPEIVWNFLEGDQRFLYYMDHQGVYIGAVGPGTLASTLGFLPGDRITKVSDTTVIDLKQLEVIYRDQTEDRQLTLERLGVGQVVIDVSRFDIIDEEFGLALLPHHIPKVFEYNDVTQMNMMHLLRYTLRKDGSED